MNSSIFNCVQRRSPVHVMITSTLVAITIPSIIQYWAAWIMFVPILVMIYTEPKPLRDLLYGFGIFLIFFTLAVHSVIPAYGWKHFSILVCFAAGVNGLQIGLWSLTAKQLGKIQRYQTVLLISAPVVIWMTSYFLVKNSNTDSLGFEVFYYQPLVLMQIAHELHYGVIVALILFCNTTLALAIARKSYTPLVGTVCTALLVTSIFMYGTKRLASPIIEGDIRIALAQSDFPMSMLWRENNAATIFSMYETWAQQAREANVKVLLYPEYNLSRVLSYEDTIDFYAELAQVSGAYVIAGTYTDYVERDDGSTGQYNVSLTFSPEGELLGTYSAMANVPFRSIGEYFGADAKVTDTPLGKTGTLLCYDDTSRWVAEKLTAAGAQSLVVLTNPSSFSSNAIHEFQLIQDQLRAIENGLPLFRLSANGPSAVMDTYGRKLLQTLPDTQQLIITDVHVPGVSAVSL